MGNIRKRGDIWYVDITVDGKRIRRRAGKSKKLAQLLLHDIELKAERGQLDFADHQRITIPAFVKKFLDYSKTNHRTATTKRYRAALENFQVFIEEKAKIKYLSQISAQTVEEYKIWRKSVPVSKNGHPVGRVKKSSINTGAKSYTINFELMTLKTVFNLAVKWNYLSVNPASGIKKLKTEDSKRRRFLDEKECRLLLSNSSEEFYPVFFTFLHTGMRRGELVNLEWTDLNFRKREINIQIKPFWKPKTRERTIPMSKALAQLLKKHLRISNFVFTNKLGTKLNINAPRKHLIDVAKIANIPDLTEIHALRHTFISRLIEKGVDLPTVQKIVGHNDIQTTMIYTHQTTSHVKEAIEKLDY